MSDVKICRECCDVFPADEVATYDVVREDGDYPGTDLCDGCADEYGHDGDIVSIWPSEWMETLRQDIATAVDIGRHENWQPWLYHAALWESLQSAPCDMTISEFADMVRAAGGQLIAAGRDDK